MYQQKQKEQLSNIRTVFAFAQETTAAGRFSARVEAALQAGLARVRLRAALSGLHYLYGDNGNYHDFMDWRS